jgi:hypothetical protein
VQVVTKAHGEITDVDHVGSAHTDAELALLLRAARERLHPGQGELDLGAVDEAAVSTEDIADWTRAGDQLRLVPAQGPGRRPVVAGGGRVVGTASLLLWNVLSEAYDRLGFGMVGDEAFKSLVVGRIIEPTSKADTIRVLDEFGVAAPACARCSGRWPAVLSGTTAACWPPPVWRTPRGRRRAGCRWCCMTARRCTSRPTPRMNCGGSG